jgi:cell division transport system permease protein
LKTLAGSKKHRLRGAKRVLKYGGASLVRNLWLTIAATSVMTVALVAMSATLIARNIMADTAEDLKNSVEFLVFLKQETPEEDIYLLKDRFNGLETVREVRVETPEEARKKELESGDDDKKQALEVLGEQNPYLWTYYIKLVDVSDTQELDDFINTDLVVKEYQYKAADLEEMKRDAIDKIGSSVEIIDWAGLVVGGLFIIIASLIIFNTIRMAIFSRKEEIYMMKLIGAGKSFIRGPFVVEALMYGVIAAFITLVIVAGIIGIVGDGLGSYGFSVDGTLSLLRDYWWIWVVGLIVTGALIGAISSMVAVRKYLKVH